MIPAWRFFYVCVARLDRLSPTFLRVTFTGDDLDVFADNGLDQRIKVVLPLPGRGFATLPTGPDWYQAWRALPEPDRNPIRTYTVRAVRPPVREVDVDFALHGDLGPASRWAGTARVGDPVALIGPDARHPGPHGGVEFSPPAPGPLLLAGDETAVPAICAIIPTVVRATVLLEVPCAADVLPLSHVDGVEVRWLARDGAAHGSLLVPAVRSLPPFASYAWIAGESSVVRSLRRILLNQHGLSRDAVTFMGYWRHNHPE